MSKGTAKILFVSVLVLLTGNLFLNGRTTAQDKKEDSPETTEREIFMRRKLAMVNKIVEGIATEDFGLIEQGGRELVEIAESAAWKSTKDPFYGHYSSNFEQAAKGLIDAAQRKSVDKATFAYVHVTFSCTACHQHVRGTVRVAR